MPELPEVETVRRGLEPVMEGARFTAVEARRRDLRWPLPKDLGEDKVKQAAFGERCEPQPARHLPDFKRIQQELQDHKSFTTRLLLGGIPEETER